MNLNMSRRTNRLSAVVATVAVIAGGGAAYVWFTSSGNGSGTGITGSSQAFTISSSAATGVYALAG